MTQTPANGQGWPHLNGSQWDVFFLVAFVITLGPLWSEIRKTRSEVIHVIIEWKELARAKLDLNCLFLKVT